MAVSEMFFISTSTSTARSRSERLPSSGGTGGSHRGAAASSRSRSMPAGDPRRNSTSPGTHSTSPSTSVIQSRSRRIATTRMPVCTGSSSADNGRRARCEFSRTRTRCETSSALDRSATSSRGMPRRCVTIRAMSTASLPMFSIAEMTWSTDAISSASCGRRAASTHTARMSCTSELIFSSSSPTSSAMSGSPKYSAA